MNIFLICSKYGSELMPTGALAERSVSMKDSELAPDGPRNLACLDYVLMSEFRSRTSRGEHKVGTESPKA